MNHVVLPGCSVPEEDLFRKNSTLEKFFREFNELTGPFAVKSIVFVSASYFLINTFHLIILTRPTMKSLSVSKEMILIAVSGIVSGSLGVVKNMVEMFRFEILCANSFSYVLVTLGHFLVFQVFNQVILWEIVYITFLRATIILDVRHGMYASEAIQPAYSFDFRKTERVRRNMKRFIYTVFIVFLLNHIVRISFHRIEHGYDELAMEELAARQCKLDKIYTINSFAGNCLRRILLSIAGITSLIIPIFIMCALSVFLVFELRSSATSSSAASNHNSTQSDNRKSNAASALLLFLCFYVLAELPYVVLFSVGLYNPADFEQLDEYIYIQVDMFIYVNMSLGILVYCLMSSQYRDTVLITFWRKNKAVVGDQNRMGLCQSEEEKLGSQKSRAIDKEIRQTQSTDERTVKLLLLGAGECGKSTVLKQMRLLSEKNFTPDELDAQAKLVFTNIVVEMDHLIKAMPSAGLDFSSPLREHDCRSLTLYIKDMHNKVFRIDAAEPVQNLWKDPKVKKLYAERRLHNIRDIGDNTEYFFDNIERISKEDYVPSAMDTLLLRTKTTGIVEVQFEIKKVKFRVFDVGGQRSERKKWIHCFEDVNAIIFIAALSEYNEVLFEDETTNRMVESMRLFESICNSRWFHNTNIILFLNKKDLFEEKIKHENIQKAFPEYRGEQTYTEAVQYIKNKFEMLSNNPKKTIYVHETCATDTNQVQKILDSVISMIIQNNLHKSGLY
ncbi:unnamed protein product [Caenorhabditis sp. 36 PRJEB53466]|nr:unnamed protein product [Caenorhabditis sp. 36 PRJEB53466]